MLLVNMQVSNNLRIDTAVIMNPPNLEHSTNKILHTTIAD